MTAPRPQWAVLRVDDDALYDDEASARQVLACFGGDSEGGFRLYLVTPVPAALEASGMDSGQPNLWFTKPAEFPVEVAEREDRERAAGGAS